jgi:hypothetical protein
VAASDDIPVHCDRDAPIAQLEESQQLLEAASLRNAARLTVYLDHRTHRNGAVGGGVGEAIGERSFLHAQIVASWNTGSEGRAFDLR